MLYLHETLLNLIHTNKNEHSNHHLLLNKMLLFSLFVSSLKYCS